MRWFIRLTLFIFGIMGLCMGLLRSAHSGTTDLHLIAGNAVGDGKSYLRVSGDLRQLPLTHFQYVYDWSPDGEWLIGSGRNGEYNKMVALNLADNTQTLLIQENLHHEFQFEGWSPNGEWLMFSVFDSAGPITGRAYLLRLHDQFRLNYFGDLQSVAWSLDGERVALAHIAPGATSSDLVVMRTNENAPQYITPNDGTVENVRFTPNGEWILFVVRAESEQALYRVRPDGSDLHLLCQVDGAHYLQDYIISPNSEWAVCHIKNTQTDSDDLYSTSIRNSQSHLIPDAQSLPQSVMFSPDSEWIIYADAGTSGHVILYRTRPDGSQTERISGRYSLDYSLWLDNLHPVAFSADNNLFFFFTSNPSGLTRVDIHTGEITTIGDIPFNSDYGYALLSPDRNSVWTFEHIRLENGDDSIENCRYRLENYRIADSAPMDYGLILCNTLFFSGKWLLFQRDDFRLYGVDITSGQGQPFLDFAPNENIKDFRRSLDGSSIVIATELSGFNQSKNRLYALDMVMGVSFTFPFPYQIGIMTGVVGSNTVLVAAITPATNRAHYFQIDMSDMQLTELHESPFLLTGGYEEYVSPAPMPPLEIPYTILLFSAGMLGASLLWQVHYSARQTV